MLLHGTPLCVARACSFPEPVCSRRACLGGAIGERFVCSVCCVHPIAFDRMLFSPASPETHE